jgi:hypothetical protein
VFLFDFAGHRCRREEKEKKPVSACCFLGGRAASRGGALLHAPPVAVARCSTRRHCSSTVAAIPEVFLCNSRSFWDCFVNFGLFNVIFI